MSQRQPCSARKLHYWSQTSGASAEPAVPRGHGMVNRYSRPKLLVWGVHIYEQPKARDSHAEIKVKLDHS